MYFGKRLAGLTEVFNNQNFNLFQSSLSLSILASFCICCYSYLLRPSNSLNVFSGYFYVSFNLVAVFTVWPLMNLVTQLFNYFRSLQPELANKIEFSLLPEVLPSVHAPSANFANPKSFSSPEPLGYFVTDEWPFTLTVFNHIVQVKFSTKLAINLNSILAFSFLNDSRRSNFRTVLIVVPCELTNFRTGQRFARYSENAS